MSSATKRINTPNHGAKPGAGNGTRVAAAPSGRSASWLQSLADGQPTPVRVVLIDDDMHLREAIARELSADKRIDLVAQAASVRDGKRVITAHQFDVLFVDLKLRDGSGFELIEYTKRVHPQAEVVVVTVMEDDASALHAFALGAAGYLIKGLWFGSFPDAVMQVMKGGVAITPTLVRRLLRRLDGICYPGDKPKARADAEHQKLSVREREILQLVAAGHTSCEIGKHLAISNLTVDAHLKNVFRKLGVRTRAQAVSRANDWDVL